jgi:large subunit ribosomal protein L28
MVATKRRFDPNLQKIRIERPAKSGGVTASREYVCTRCIKAGKVVKAV